METEAQEALKVKKEKQGMVLLDALGILSNDKFSGTSTFDFLVAKLEQVMEGRVHLRSIRQSSTVPSMYSIGSSYVSYSGGNSTTVHTVEFLSID